MSGPEAGGGVNAVGGGAGPYRLGLAMAGAISAGAYSAGVFDFLIQALEEWHRARERGEPDVPSHDVVLQVIAGASAGAIVGGIGVVSLAEGIRLPDGPQPDGAPAPPLLPRLYRAWVDDPAMLGPDGVGFLATDDLDGPGAPKELRSLLNGGVVDALLARALADLDPAAAPKPYLARDLDLYFTVSNLRGIPYQVHFTNGDYGMSTHADRFHYRVQGLGTTPVESPFGAADGAGLHVADLAGPQPSWQAFGHAAVASGAFPMGLAAQALELPTTDYAQRHFPLADQRAARVDGLHFPAEYLATAQPYRFVAVDGGMINNEPFEYARCALLQPGFERNPTAGAAAYGAVVMVDPFPDQATLPPEDRPGRDILSVLKALLPALIAQSRFKVEELLLAASTSIRSRFILQPARTHLSPVLGQDVEAPYALACGLLGGFGGFLDRGFRAHDFQLGRRNCQKFLSDHFTLPAGNTAVAGWPPVPKGRETSPPELPVIPLYGSARTPVELVPWPRMSQADFTAISAGIAVRSRAVLLALIRAHAPPRMGRVLAHAARSLFQGDIDAALTQIVLADLVRRDQIEGWDLATPAYSAGMAETTARHVAAALLDLSYPARSATGIAAELARSGVAVSSAEVGELLDLFTRAFGTPYVCETVAGRDEPYYRLLERRAWWQRLPGANVVERFVWRPAKDHTA